MPHDECLFGAKIFSTFVVPRAFARDNIFESVFAFVLVRKSDSFQRERTNEQHSFLV